MRSQQTEGQPSQRAQYWISLTVWGGGFWYGHRQRDTIINSTVLVFINIFKDFDEVTYRGKPTLRDTVLVFINSINWISLTMEGEGNFSPNMQ